MDKIESLKEINKSIKGLTNQRNSEALDMVGFNEINSAYYSHAPQLAMIAGNDFLTTAVIGSMALGVGVVYGALLKKHYLSKDINALKTLRAVVSDNYNILEDTSKEEFESDVATRKYVKK